MHEAYSSSSSCLWQLRSERRILRFNHNALEYSETFGIVHDEDEGEVMGVKPNGKLLETNMAVKACDSPLLHGASQCSRCPPARLPE